MGDSDSEEHDSDEVNEAFEEAKAGLQGGTLTCFNSNGTYRCPFSPGRKKQNYKYNDLHQHAVGVGKGNRGPVAVGRHRALVAYLDSKHMAGRAQPQAERRVYLQQDIPPRLDCEDKRVFPWMGILQNIDNHTRRSEDGFRTGAGAAAIKEKLKAFNPESVKVLYDVRGHQGVAVIQFRSSIDGYKDAEAFENSFFFKRRGREDFEKDNPTKCGTHLYGWMATKKDVEGGSKLLIDHLKSYGDLKSLTDIVRELEDIADQQVQKLKKMVIKNEGVLQVTAEANWGLSNKVDYVTAQREQAEHEKQKLIQDHKKELEDLQQEARSAEEDHDRNMRIYRSQIERRMRELEMKSAELETLKLENEAEKAEKQETERLLAWYKGQAKQQENQIVQHIELIEKHKKENENLENKMQEERKKLQERHRRELESRRVTEQLETEKAKKAEILEAKIEETDKEKEEYVKRIAELEGKLEAVTDLADDATDLVNTLTTSQREVNDEVEEARATVMQSQILSVYGTAELGVKNLGELNTEGWYEVCKNKFKSPGTFQHWVSELDGKLRTHDFHPLKTVPDGKPGKMKYAVDENDATLTELRNKYGRVVADAVGAAALEIENWNPSGRYIIRIPWDFIENKKASMSKLFQLYAKVLKEKDDELKEKEKELKEKDHQLKELINTQKRRKRRTQHASHP
ncbi:hypothetical protein M758_4G132100 [Ceratodon purpureus]|nr:hypothetical protein M758_4G132100 [Ceratodon purpureus]